MSMFDALKGLGNPLELMRKAQEMQAKMKQLQDEMARKQVTAEAGEGMVRATVNGQLTLTQLRIDKTKVDVNDTELLEDAIVAAVAAAQTKAADTMKQEMQKLATDAGIPPNMLP